MIPVEFSPSCPARLPWGARLLGALPWRVRRRAERALLAALRFGPAPDVLHVSGAPAPVSLLALGDLALGGAIESAFAERGPEGLAGGMLPVFERCHLRVANLESVLTTAAAPSGPVGAYLKAGPEMAKLLAACRIDAVTAANNHALDYGPGALVESLATLDRHGIAHCGAGPSPEEARQPVLLEAGGIQVGMLGYADDYRIADGARMLAGLDAATILAGVAALRPTVQLLVVQLHLGYEFSLFPLLSHRGLARRIAAAGADLVLCHHAHVPMGLEVLNGKLIAYGLGNFLFPPTPYMLENHPWTGRSFALQVHFGPRGVSSARLIPCGMGPDLCVRMLEGADRARMLAAVSVISRRLACDSLLAALERDRIVREALRFLDLLTRDDGLAETWAVYLRAPRQQEVIRALAEGGEEARPAGLVLQQCAAGLRPPLDFEAARRAATLLRNAARLPEDLPGRTPWT